MTDRPWMPLYVGDYLADTQHLTAYEHGAYLLLLMHHWRSGKLPPNDEHLARIARVHPPHWRRVKKVLIQFFDVQEDGSWIQKRLAQELSKMCEISNKRKAAALQKHSKSTANAVQLHTHSHSHSHSHKKERKRKPVAEPPEFVDFWNSVPRKEGRYESVIAYRKAIELGADPQKVNAAAKRWRATEEKTEEKFIALPATWLNKRRFEDYHAPPERESDLEYDPETKEWRWKSGLEPQKPERTN